MTKELTCLNKVFEGNSITTLTYKGRPAWIAREIGTVIGYSQGGKRLANRITGEWSGEFAQDKDYAVLKDEELREFKELLGVAPEGPLEGLCRIPSMLILFESGLHLVLNKTNKPVGVRLRRFLADEVMPQIVRTGAYDPECRVEGEKVVDRGGNELRAQREWRLAQRERRLWEKLQYDKRKLEGNLEHTNKKLKIDTVTSMVGTMGDQVSNDSLVALKLMAIEIATGEDLSVFKPKLDSGWESPSQIGKRMGVSANYVGKVITELGLRGHPELSKRIMNASPHNGRSVPSFLYRPEAVKQIEERIVERQNEKLLMALPN